MLLPASIAFIYGLIFGSFTTALIHRLYTNKPGLINGRSQCPYCEKPLKVLNLIPIVSWLIQRGRCQYCSKPISFSYPLTELGSGLIFSCFTLKFWGVLELWPILAILAFSFVLFLYDTLHKIVDLRIVVPAILFTLLWSFFRVEPWWDYWLAGGIGWSFYACQYYGSGGRWVGSGDQYLGAFMGLVLGLKFGFLGLFFAYILGSFVAAYLLIIKRKNSTTAVPMGAFLVPGLWLMLYSGESIWQWYYVLILGF